MPNEENDKSQEPPTVEEKQAEIKRVKELREELSEIIPSGPDIPTGTDILRGQRDSRYP